MNILEKIKTSPPGSEISADEFQDALTSIFKNAHKTPPKVIITDDQASKIAEESLHALNTAKTDY